MITGAFAIALVMSVTGPGVGVVGKQLLPFPPLALAPLACFSLLFFGGALFAWMERKWGTLGALLVILTMAASVMLIIGHPAPAALVALAGLAPAAGGLWVPRWLRPKVDISYGFYLYAFPVQQFFVLMVPTSFWWSLAPAAGATLAMATLSACLIEQPALALKRKPISGELWGVLLRKRSFNIRPKEQAPLAQSNVVSSVKVGE
jgi:peptidoglycan/LPS O-acetylase OafA/YrhL